MYNRIWLLPLYLLLIARIANCEEPPSIKSLRGLKGFGVMVIIESDVKLSEDIFQNALELKLRQNGIGVETNSFATYLIFHIHLIKRTDIAICIFNVRLFVNRAVIVSYQKDKEMLFADIWSESLLGSAGEGIGLERPLLEKLDQLMIYFLNDYFTANPK